MPSTHLSLHYHIIFSTKDRAPIIAPSWRERLHAFLGGAIRTADGIPEAIGGVAEMIDPIIDTADRVIFLGFGFWPENVDLLKLKNPVNGYVRTAAYHASAFGLSQAIQNELINSHGMKFGKRDETVDDFIREHAVITFKPPTSERETDFLVR